MSPKNNIPERLTGRKIPDLVFFIPVFLLCLYLAWNINFAGQKGPYRKIYSDKAHYYVYLPATFIYGWDIHKFPAGIEKKCEGFLLDKKTNKVIIKTTCGVAILIAPFFLVTHLVALQWNLQPNGFSDFYQQMTILPGVFYLVLGLFFLQRFLRRYFSRGISWLTVLLILAGTNLFDYGIYDGLMSHVYSFFLFSLFLFLLKKFLDSGKKSYGLFLGMSIVLSLAILIRPTNILLMTWMLFLDVKSWKEIRARLILFLKPTYILIFLVTAFIIFLPQFFYWKYLTGHFVYYSYPNEGFTNWKQPQMIPAWFSTLNGLFIYTPLVFFFVAGMLFMIVKKVPNGTFIGLSFLLASYVFSSWSAWFFGGSFGYRPMVEYYALFSLPFAWFISGIGKIRNLFVKSIIVVAMVFSSYYNLVLTYHQRWDTNSVWSWDDYLFYLDYTGLYDVPMRSYTYRLDFENFGMLDLPPTRFCVHSPTLGSYIDKWNEYNKLYSRQLENIFRRQVRRVDASIWVNPWKKATTGTLFVCRIGNDPDRPVYEKTLKIDDFIKDPSSWNLVSGTFEIPEWIDQKNEIRFMIRNIPRTDSVYFDDMKLRFE
ncbi:MAG: hypothetical protein NTU98_09470 [Bacteroidetes bacterium]|nr:hypothetical protein [Bacteroidota bacterium]